MKPDGKMAKTLLILALLAAAAVYWHAWYRPGQRQIADLRKQIEDKQQTLAQSESVTAAIRTTQQEVDRALTYNHAWEEAAPSLTELSDLFGRISELIKSHNTNTVLFDPDPPVRRETLSEVALRISLSAPFHQITNFLQELERLTAAAWIESLRISVGAKDGKDTAGDIDLLIFANNSENSGYINPTAQPIH